MTTERVATRVSDAEMQRRWDAVRKLMRERGIEALVAYGTEDWLGGHARWFTDIPTHNGYGRTVVFHADDLMSVVEQGNFGARRELAGKDPYHRGVGEILYTSFFSSVHYTTAYQGEIVRELFKKRGYKTIGFVVPGTMPHRLVQDDHRGLRRAARWSTSPTQIDRLIAIKSDEELELMRRCAEMQDAIFQKVLKEIKPGMRDVDVTAMAYREGWVRGSSQGIYLGGSAPMGKPSFLVGRHFQDRPLQNGRQPELPDRGQRARRLLHRGRPHHRAWQGVGGIEGQFRDGDGGAGLFREPAQARCVMPRGRQGA